MGKVVSHCHVPVVTKLNKKGNAKRHKAAIANMGWNRSSA